ncbi:MAG: hypothetical protein ACP5VR_08460 [Acidimicrobiales bacterium]
MPSALARQLRLRASLARAGIAAAMVTDELFATPRVARWLRHGTPAGMVELASAQ